MKHEAISRADFPSESANRRWEICSKEIGREQFSRSLARSMTTRLSSITITRRVDTRDKRAERRLSWDLNFLRPILPR